MSRDPRLEKARRGKLTPFPYYLRGVGWRLVPRPLLRLRRRLLLRGWEKRPDADYIRDRVDFYCKAPFRPNYESMSARRIDFIDMPSAYYFDIQRYLRAFSGGKKLNYLPGDTFANPGVPSIIRSRRLDYKTENGVLLNLNHRRHFLRPADPIPFADKKPVLFFRGEMEGKPHRSRCLELWKDSPLTDIGDTNAPYDQPGHKPPVALIEHFQYKFILVLEGNDVASATQWVMASNCVPVMTRPTVEGWLMHSRLVPGIHYIEIAPDFSDVEDKIRYYLDHPAEAEKISEESRRWAAQFNDPRREEIISLLVLRKYLG